MLTMEPPPADRRCGIAYFMPAQTPLRFTDMTRSQSASEMFSALPGIATPALLTMPSSRPSACAARSTKPAISDRTDTSTRPARTSCAWPPSRSASSEARSPSTSAMATRAPSSTSRTTIASPMPAAPPVTTNALPSSLFTRRLSRSTPHSVERYGETFSCASVFALPMTCQPHCGTKGLRNHRAARAGMATIKDVAASAGVAPSIVSRLLNGDPTVRVRPETRLRVLAAAAELNYTPNRAARALRRTRVGALGVALRQLTSPVYAQIFSGAEDAARSADFLLVAIEVDALAADPAALHRFIPGGAVDGLLLQRDGLPADDLVLESVQAAKLPFVIVNERVEDPLLGVALDDVRASRMAGAAPRPATPG